MAEANSPNYLDFYNTLQLWDLQNEIASQTGLLEAIEERLFTAEAQQAKERFIANLYYAAEKIFNDLKTLPESDETAALCLEFHDLFVVELQMAISQTSHIEIKRDIDRLTSAFKTYATFTKNPKYTRVTETISKIQRVRTTTKSLYASIERLDEIKYYRPLIIVIMNFAIWPIAFFLGGWRLIFYYYIVAILIRIFGPTWVRYQNNKKKRPIVDEIEQNRLLVKGLQIRLQLQKSYKVKHDTYTIWLDDLLNDY